MIFTIIKSRFKAWRILPPYFFRNTASTAGTDTQ